MVPSVPLVLNGMARAMLMDLMPHNTHAYAGQTLQLGAALAMMCAQEFDRAAARLTKENEALAALLGEAAAVVSDMALGDALRDAATSRCASLLISDLHNHNRTLRGLLIRLHTHVETLGGDAARALEGRIWDELAQSTRRRQLDIAM